MENENEKEKKGKKLIVILIIAILLAVILALAIALPLTLGKKTEPKEATITLTATKGSGAGSFTPQKWFTKVGEETTQEHTITLDTMSITAKSGETVYFGYSYTLTYQYEGGAYLENLTYNSRLLNVNYILCAEGTNNIEQFDAAIADADADWQTWTEATPQSTENFLIIKIEIQELTENETLPIDVTLAVVDGEYLGRPLSITWTNIDYVGDGFGWANINLCYVKLGDDGEAHETQNQNSPANLYIKEGETMYVGFCIEKNSNFFSWLASATASADLTVSGTSFEPNYGNDAPTLDDFNNVLKGDVSWTPCQDMHNLTTQCNYFLLIFKIEANEEFTVENLSFYFNIWLEPEPE